MPEKTSKKIYMEIHFIRAIACLLVVMVHVTAAYYSVNNRTFDFFSLSLNQIARLGTPVFAVISGFLLFNSVKNKGFHLKHFLISRTTKILMPFVIWTIIYLLIRKWYLHQTLLANWQDFFYSYLVLGDGFYHLYFMVTVLQFYILFPFIRLIRNKGVILFVFILTCIISYYSLSAIEWRSTIENDYLRKLVTDRSFITNWIIYFLLGAVMAYYWEEVVKFSQKYYKLIGLLFVFALLGIGMEFMNNGILNSSRPSMIFYIPVFVLFLLSIYPRVAHTFVVREVLTFIGKYSMGIYLIHPFIITYLKEWIPVEIWRIEYLLIIYVVTVLLSIVMARLILRIPKSQYIIPVPPIKSKKQHSTVAGDAA
jgi:probable poly-beta-1,6-N-acetyl-D-glucosamine export protein